MNFLRTTLFALLLLLLVCAAFFAGYLFQQRQSTAINLPLLNQAYTLLEQNGYKAMPSPPALEYGMIRGMLQSYGDPYTVFVEPAQAELQTDTLEGKYGGIGTQLSRDTQGNWVLFPFQDSPASKAGLQEGDRLLAVGKMKVDSGVASDSIDAAIRGPVGSTVTLTVGHAPGYEPVEISIKREEIPLPSVTWHLDTSQPEVGIVKVNIIAASTPDEIQRAVKDLQSRGAAHYLLDLRDNPGGLLNSGIEIARLFLKEGMVMQLQYHGKDVETFKVNKGGPLADIPLAILINHGSASAAEIAAGALQAQKRAPLIGSASYGKDTIQLVFVLQDGSSIHVTSAHWWVPGLSAPIEGKGLQPDIPVEASTDAANGDPVIQAGIQYLLGLK